MFHFSFLSDIIMIYEYMQKIRTLPLISCYKEILVSFLNIVRLASYLWDTDSPYWDESLSKLFLNLHAFDKIQNFIDRTGPIEEISPLLRLAPIKTIKADFSVCFGI